MEYFSIPKLAAKAEQVTMLYEDIQKDFQNFLTQQGLKE